MSRWRCTIVGGGPAGLSLALELAKLDYDIEVYQEPHPAGVGIVLDEDAIALLDRVDTECAGQVLDACQSWDAVHLRISDERIVSGGHHIRGIARDTLVEALGQRAAAVGVRLLTERWNSHVPGGRSDLLVGADGVGSTVRQASASEFGALVATSKTRFLWIQAEGRLDAGFSFVATAHGAYVAHVYPYSERCSAIVVESRPECLASAGLLHADRSMVERSLTRIFRDHLRIGWLRAVTFPWQPFRTVRNRRWHAGNRVLIGDAAHTAHFSVGSGTKLAIEDAVALAAELGRHADLETAVGRYEAVRRPEVARVQADARSSEIWFADLDRHVQLPPYQLAFALRTRREVNGYGWLKQRDPRFVARLHTTLRADSRFPADASDAVCSYVPEPRLLPLKLGQLVIPHRAAVVVGGDKPPRHGDAGLVLRPVRTRPSARAGTVGVPAAGTVGATAAGTAGAPAALIVPAPCEASELAGEELPCLLLTGKWPEVRDALITLRRHAGNRTVGALVDPESWDEAEAPLLARMVDFVAVPPAPKGQRVERTLLAERLRNELGLTVLLWTRAMDTDEANTLIAAGRTDGYVISEEG